MLTYFKGCHKTLWILQQPLQNCIKVQESKGYEQWAKIHKLKQTAKTLNFLNEYKFEKYADLTSQISKIAVASEQAADSLKSAEKWLADMAMLINKHTRNTKPVYDAYWKAKNKVRYRANHERGIILHKAAVKALQTTGIKKLPNLTVLQSEYEQLQAQKEALYADYEKLKKQVKEYDWTDHKKLDQKSNDWEVGFLCQNIIMN